MLSRLPVIGIIFSAGLACAASAQTARESYLQDCLTGVGLQALPSFECADGVPLETSMFGEACDAMAHLPDHGCAAGSRLGKLPLPNPDVSGVYVCRKYEDELADSRYGITLDNNQYSDIALIVHNQRNGKTCFFQSDVPNILDGSITPAELVTSAWREPARQAMCTECHASDVFLVTPYVVKEFQQLGLMHPDPRGPYVVVGSAADDTRSRDYGALTAGAPISREEGCAGACHFMPQAANHEFYGFFVEDALALGWMPAMHGSYWTTDVVIEEDAEDDQLDFFHNAGSQPWQRATWSTPTWGTGPERPAAGSRSYFYLESSSGQADNAGDSAILESEWFEARHARLTFDYHMYGADIGSLHVDIWTGDRWRNNLWARLGGGEPRWQSASVDLHHLSGQDLIKLRLRARATGGSLGDIAIDNIEVRRTR